MSGNEPNGAILEIARLFEEAEVHGCLIGGHAVNFHLEPRFTEDIDFTIAADPAQIARLRSAFLRAGYEVRSESAPQSPSGPDFLRFVRSAAPPVEFLTAKTPFQESVLRRSRPVPGARWLSVATPEDLIVMKLIADRRKDQNDLLGLVELPGLDWPYIEAEARVWEIEDRLARLRAGRP